MQLETLLLNLVSLPGIGRCFKHLGWTVIKQAIRRKFPRVQHVSTETLAMIAPAEKPILLDTRTADEYTVSHLANAQLVDPYRQDFSDFDLPRDRSIVTYCSVGYRSSATAERLQAAGYTHVANLEGSIFEWANQGRPVYCHGEVVQQVHPYSALWGHLLDRELHYEV